MKRFDIKLMSQEDIQTFVRICSGYDVNIDISKGANQTYDAKSIMAVMTLDTTNNTYIIIHSGKEQVINSIYNNLKEFIVGGE